MAPVKKAATKKVVKKEIKGTPIEKVEKAMDVLRKKKIDFTYLK